MARRLLIMLVVLVGAAVCYVAGFGLGITLLLVGGAILELALWILALTMPSSGDDAA